MLYSEVDGILLETAAWYDWLENHTTFYLESAQGTFTARREVRAGGSFWYAFRRVRRKLYKVTGQQLRFSDGCQVRICTSRTDE
jgi:hypothetical protein